MPLNDDEAQAFQLMADIMEANSKWTADLTNSLMDSYKQDADKARAELKAVRISMNKLFASGYMPTEGAIMDALYPDPRLIDAIVNSENILMLLETVTTHVFSTYDLEKVVLDLYGQDIDIIQDMIIWEFRNNGSYQRCTVDGESELSEIGDIEIVKVWTETGQLTGIDQSNDSDWDDSWDWNEYANVEVRHILHRLFKEGHIPAGNYLMTVSW